MSSFKPEQIDAYIVCSSDYTQIKNYNNLPFVQNDMELFKKSLIDGLNINIDNIEIKSGRIRREDYNSIVKNIKEKSKDTRLCIFYYSGHGTKDSSIKLGDGSKISINTIINELENTSYKNHWIIIDSCYSGGALIKYNFENISFNKGTIISCSSSKTEQSYPTIDGKYSFFTKVLTDTLINFSLKTNGKKSLQKITNLVRIIMGNNHDNDQTFINKSNQLGTIYIDIDEKKTNIKSINDYKYESKDYIIKKVEPVHNSIIKKYRISIILKNDELNINALSKEIIKKAEEIEIYNNDIQKRILCGKK